MAEASDANVLSVFWKKYKDATAEKIRLLDAFLVFTLVTAVVQFVYCVLVSRKTCDFAGTGSALFTISVRRCCVSVCVCVCVCRVTFFWTEVSALCAVPHSNNCLMPPRAPRLRLCREVSVLAVIVRFSLVMPFVCLAGECVPACHAVQMHRGATSTVLCFPALSPLTVCPLRAS